MVALLDRVDARRRAERCGRASRTRCSAKASASLSRGVGAGLVGEIDLGRREVGVAHPLLQLARVGGRGSAWVPKVWRRSWKRSGRSPAASRARSCSGVAAPSRRGSRRAAPGNTRSSAAGERAARGRAGRAPRPTAATMGTARPLPDLRRRQRAMAVARADADQSQLEVDVAPAQREQLSHAKAGERRGEVDGCRPAQ